MRVFQVRGVDDAHASYTLSGVLLPDGCPLADSVGDHEYFANDCGCCCPPCHSPHDHYVQGFSYLLELDPTRTAFLGTDLVYVTARQQIFRLANALTGCAQINIGYKDWDQSGELPEEQRFSTEPLLGALYITAVCDDYLANGSPPERCPRCGRPDRDSVRYDAELRPSRSAYPGTDLFLLEGWFQNRSFVTEEGLEKLRRLGYHNLLITEVAWS